MTNTIPCCPECGSRDDLARVGGVSVWSAGQGRWIFEPFLCSTTASYSYECSRCGWTGDDWEKVHGNKDTFESLTAEYNAWLEVNNLPPMSADELVCEIAWEKDLNADPALRAQVKWLEDFIIRWNAMWDVR